MDNDKADYRKGLVYFCILMVCIVSWFTVPDGDTLFYKFIGWFGLSPGIHIGSSGTLYPYLLIPLIAAILSIKKIFKYWQGYGLRFKEHSALLRLLPMLIMIPVLLFSNIISPSLLDRAYFAVISQRDGLRSISYYVTNEHLSYEFTGNDKTYSYDLAFGNHSDQTLEFTVKLAYRDRDGLQEVFIKGDSGELQIFSLAPKELAFFRGEFTERRQTAHENRSGRGRFSVVLINDDEQYSPKPLLRSPLL